MRAGRVAALLVVVLGSAPAGGHTSRVVKRETLRVEPGRLALEVGYEISERAFAADLRERFDRDASGTLSTEERRAAAEYARELATADLEVRWDGALLEPSCALEAASGLERPLPSAYPISFVWRLEYRPPASPPGAHRLELADREPRWRSDVLCRVRLGAGVAGAGADRAGGRDRSFVFRAGRGSLKILVSTESRADG
jgi:hypothetical protein